MGLESLTRVTMGARSETSLCHDDRTGSYPRAEPASPFISDSKTTELGHLECYQEMKTAPPCLCKNFGKDALIKKKTSFSLTLALVPI